MNQILVAGIGNIFFGDDAFGVEVIRALREHPFPAGVRIEDFGIRSYDLAYALMDGYDAVILVDATPRGQSPGTVSLIEPALDGLETLPAEMTNAHGMNPAVALQLVHSMGGTIRRLYLVGCEPAILDTDEIALSPEVQAAIPHAVELIASLVETLISATTSNAFPNETPEEVNLP
jgi:hydrogenase maturation protease